MASSAWSIKIVVINGTTYFQPDLAGAQPGQGLGCNTGDSITWNNMTDAAHYPVASSPAGTYLTEPIPAGQVSSPIFQAPASGTTVTYACQYHSTETGSIVVLTARRR